MRYCNNAILFRQISIQSIVNHIYVRVRVLIDNVMELILLLLVELLTSLQGEKPQINKRWRNSGA